MIAQPETISTCSMKKAVFKSLLKTTWEERYSSANRIMLENKSSFDGTLSQHEFRETAKALLGKWNSYASVPHWTWTSCPEFPFRDADEEEGYLSLESYCSAHEDNFAEGNLLEEQFEDVATMTETDHREIHRYNFHIVYSASYRVPVLYFRGYQTDGRSFDWDTIKEDLPASSNDMLEKSKWTFITKEEHPYLNQPWLTLHPCGTSEWMRNLFSEDSFNSQVNQVVPISQYLLSWLSFTGQAVGLKVPIELFNSSESGDTNNASQAGT